MFRLVASTVFFSLMAHFASVAAAEFPEPLAAALAAADARVQPDTRLTFIRDKKGDAETAFSARFDPKAEKGKQWTVLTPPKETWSASQKDSIAVLYKQHDADLPLIVTSDFAEQMLGDDIVVLEETTTRIRYGASVESLPPTPGSPRGQADSPDFLKHLKAEIDVLLDPSKLDSFRIFAPKPFKPVVVAKVDALDIRLKIGEAWAEGPIAITGLDRVIKGSAALVTFDESARIAYREFAPVPAAR